ncbi:MAG: MtrB/PioB family outer membrane beta-barrel protein, partial [Desulfobulbus sp.]|nr:MtrB/PioB family outer membrane beta-barrel protein [Desulfobulbus sp.]
EAQVGRYNSWKVKAFYNETPHVFSTTVRDLFVSGGSVNGIPLLVYNPSLPAGTNLGVTGNNGATNATNINAAQALPANNEMMLVRKKGGIKAELAEVDNFKFYASATQEQRKGERPFGVNGTQGVEGFEPIDYTTTDFAAGVQYWNALEKLAFNARVSYSKFEDNNKGFFAQNQGAVAGAAPAPTANIPSNFTTGMSLNGMPVSYLSTPPNNDAINFKLDGSKQFDWWNSRLTGSVAFGQMKQNDSLTMVPNVAGLTLSSNPGAGVLPTDINNWNGVNGCWASRCKADAKMDTSLYNLNWSMDPVDDLTVRAGFRQYKNDNKTPTFFGVNPLTGTSTAIGNTFGFQAGSVMLANLPFANTLIAPGTANGATIAGQLGVQNVANAYAAFGNNGSKAWPGRGDKTTNYTLSGEYSINRFQNVNLELEREDINYTYRERGKTWEDKFKLTYVNRDIFENASFRASYEYDRKRGSDYSSSVMGRELGSFMMYNGVAPTIGNVMAMINAAAASPTAILKLGPGGGTYDYVGLQTILGATSANSGSFMKPDIADRNQNILNARLNYSPRDDLDLGLNLQVRRAKYRNGDQFNSGPWDTSIGLQQNNTNSLSLDATWQAASNTQVSGYYQFQYGKLKSVENYTGTTNGTVAATAASTTAKCGPLAGTMDSMNCWINAMRDPAANVDVDSTDKTQMFGGSLTHDFGWFRLGMTYNYVHSQTSMKYKGAAMNNLAANVNSAAYDAYGQLPDMTTTMHNLEVDLIKNFTKSLAVRLMYRLDKYSVKDWHYDYLDTATNAAGVPAGYMASDMGTLNFNINTFGAFLQYKF